MLLVFPEGTRSPDGQIGPFKSGFCALARRSNITLLPVGIDGAYKAWPRSSMLPRMGTVHIHIGSPMSAADIAALESDEALIDEVVRRIDIGRVAASQAIARATRNR